MNFGDEKLFYSPQVGINRLPLIILEWINYKLLTEIRKSCGECNQLVRTSTEKRCYKIPSQSELHRMFRTWNQEDHWKWVLNITRRVFKEFILIISIL